MSPAFTPSCACRGASDTSLQADGASLQVALVGTPNAGKSALFNRLSGRYVTVSNYPGTSVEISRGTAVLNGRPVSLLDTPGVYSLASGSEEQAAVRRYLLRGEADVLVQVADARNLPRMLALTLQLLELGRPVVLAANMMDEAERAGVRFDPVALTGRLGIPVVPLVAVTGRGIPELERAILSAAAGPALSPPIYGNGVGTAIRRISAALQGQYDVGRAALAALLLQEDPDAIRQIAATEPDGGRAVLALARAHAGGSADPPAYRLAVARQAAAREIAEGVVHHEGASRPGRARQLSHWLTHPVTGFPILLLILYFGLYRFVGQFGGGTLVDWLEGTLFEKWLNPVFTGAFAWVPSPSLQALFVGEYGVLTLGLRYAVAIILPIVGAFFLFFAVLEDTGYLPRLALLVDRLFKRLGLSGRAVIPIVLGFACVTMATMVTRTLETRRERLLATLLLALAIPCSAQLGVILALMAHQPVALAVWVIAVLAIFTIVGLLSARLLPGPSPLFHMELPPLRKPRLRNVVTKTVARMQWYFLEVLPLFLLASVLLWAGQLSGVLGYLSGALEPVVGALSLPLETAAVFLLGFFRRDYGAAGLYDLQHRGLLDATQLAVAAVTLTLFIPCVAQFLMMMKERGSRTAVAMFLVITPTAFGVGFLLNRLLRWIV